MSKKKDTRFKSDRCTNKSVILTNTKDEMVDFNPDQIQKYHLIQGEKPQLGQVYAFKSVSKTRYNKNVQVQYVGYLKQLEQNEEICHFLILFDGNRSKTNARIIVTKIYSII